MDKKNTIIGLLCLAAAFWVMQQHQRDLRESAKAAERRGLKNAEANSAAGGGTSQTQGGQGIQAGQGKTSVDGAQAMENAMDATGPIASEDARAKTSPSATRSQAKGPAAKESVGPIGVEISPESPKQTSSQNPKQTKAQGSGGANTQGSGGAKAKNSEQASSQALRGANARMLQNGFLKLFFDSHGASIREAHFIEATASGALRYPESLHSKTPYRFNHGFKTPALSLGFGSEGGVLRAWAPLYRLDRHDAGSIQFSHETAEGLKIIRAYRLHRSADGKDPYRIEHETLLQNKSSKVLQLNQLFMHLGALPPTSGDNWSEYLNICYYNDDSAEFLRPADFDASKILFGVFRDRPAIPYYPFFENQKVELLARPLSWASVKNQFFAAILSLASEPGKTIFARPVALDSEAVQRHNLQVKKSAKAPRGLEAWMGFAMPRLNPGEKLSLKSSYYVGPKEYNRLHELGNGQEAIMQFQFFAILSRLMLWALTGIQGFVEHFAPSWSWGISIVLLTLCVKILLWPVTQIQVRSTRNMSKIQGPLRELQEKYKDKPQKIQAETMKLFKENKINPLGCLLPLLIQFPIFIALFFMLRTSSQLRFAPFLWIEDLSITDTIAHIATVPINPMALAMGATMFLQMRLTPTPTADKTQQKIMQILPVIFIFFCYGFPAGLTLYWTTQNLLTIFQQQLSNRLESNKPDAPKPSTKPAAAPARRSKKRKPKA